MEDFPTQQEIEALNDRAENLTVLSDAISTVFDKVDPEHTMFPNVPDARREMEELCALFDFAVPRNGAESLKLQIRIGIELEEIALKMRGCQDTVH